MLQQPWSHPESQIRHLQLIINTLQREKKIKIAHDIDWGPHLPGGENGIKSVHAEHAQIGQGECSCRTPQWSLSKIAKYKSWASKYGKKDSLLIRPELYSLGWSCLERALPTSSFHLWDRRYISSCIDLPISFWFRDRWWSFKRGS